MAAAASGCDEGACEDPAAKAASALVRKQATAGSSQQQLEVSVPSGVDVAPGAEHPGDFVAQSRLHALAQGLEASERRLLEQLDVIVLGSVLTAAGASTQPRSSIAQQQGQQGQQQGGAGGDGKGPAADVAASGDAPSAAAGGGGVLGLAHAQLMSQITHASAAAAAGAARQASASQLLAAQGNGTSCGAIPEEGTPADSGALPGTVWVRVWVRVRLAFGAGPARRLLCLRARIAAARDGRKDGGRLVWGPGGLALARPRDSPCEQQRLQK